MKRILTIATLCLSLVAQAQDLRLRADNIQQVIEAMTIEEKAALIMGSGSAAYAKANGQNTGALVDGIAGATNGIDRLGIPAMGLSDGPAGLRLSNRTCTHFPNGSLLASTWDAELLQTVGAAMGDEMQHHGVDVILGPGLNIVRNPLNGRNFEYFSEDPLLSGLSAAAIVKGVQSQGVGACPKHFACNNQELNRLSNDARVSVRALREIYLRNFEYTIKESNPWCLMTSYNWLNGVPASENPELLTTLLRQEWGYKGVIMTDWGGGYSARRMVKVGNNLIEPGGDGGYNDIVEAAKSGDLTDEELNRCVYPILEMATRSLRFKNDQFDKQIDVEAHGRLVRQAAAEGMVLLKNEGAALPLATARGAIALLGIGSYDFYNGGTGSGDVNGAYSINLQRGLRDVGYEIDGAIDSFYNKYLESEHRRCAEANKGKSWCDNAERPLEALPFKELAGAAKTAQAAIITIGRTFGESQDRDYYHSYMLSVNERQLIRRAAEAFHAEGKPVVVILNVGGAVDVTAWQQWADAILVSWLPGEEGGHSVGDILVGEVNPSGRLPITFLRKYEDDPTAATFPDYQVNRSGNFSFLRYTGSARKYEVPGVDYTNYEEDIFVGYRYFTTNNVDVAYPFGYGLSYTTYDYSDLAVKERGDNVEISLSVTNSGKCAGREVVQIYVAAPESATLPMPARELRAYTKTQLLQPGQTERVTLTVSKERLASYDTDASSWIAEAGTYRFLACRDANTPVLTADLKLRKSFKLKTNNILGVEPLYIK